MHKRMPVLLALGATIATIVSWVRVIDMSSSPSGCENSRSIKGWIKKQLAALGCALSWLAKKASAMLPGLIGNIVSCLCATASATVSWLGSYLWALAVAAAGLLYLTASECVIVSSVMSPSGVSSSTSTSKTMSD